MIIAKYGLLLELHSTEKDAPKSSDFRQHLMVTFVTTQFSHCQQRFDHCLTLASLAPFLYTRTYHVRVTTTELQFGYKADCAAKRIDRRQIETALAIEKISACCDWGGYGIRTQFPSWEKGYMPKSGSGVRVTYKENGKEYAYTFICDEAEKVAGMLSR
jgi:hypothetical protein